MFLLFLYLLVGFAASMYVWTWDSDFKPKEFTMETLAWVMLGSVLCPVALFITALALKEQFSEYLKRIEFFNIVLWKRKDK
jgi:hypothetical protein